MVFCRVLIKGQRLLYTGILQSLCIQVGTPVLESSGIQKFRAEHRTDKLFKGHAVVSEESAHGKGKCSKDTDPADLAVSHEISKSEIQEYRNDNRQPGEHKLPEGHAEEDCFLIISDFFVDFDFYYLHLHFSDIIVVIVV